MSEVNLQFTVNNFSSTITLAATELAINPQATELTVFGGFAAYPPAGGAGDTQVTFNDAGLFAGSTNFTYNKNSNTLSVDNLNTTSIISNGPLNTGTTYVTGNVYVSDTVGANNLSVTGLNDMGSPGNLRLTNTTAGQYIKTLGNNQLAIGNLAAGGQPQQLQFNNATEFGGIPTVTWDGTDLVVGDADNVKMYGGTNGYVLQTDGSGNLTWLPQAGAISPSTGAPGGANSQIQINRAGVFGGIPGFTVNPISNVMAAINLDVATVLTAGTVRTNSLAYANGSPYVFITPAAGANTQVQFNSNGNFAGSNAFTFGTNPINSVANTLSVTNVYSTGDIRGNAITAVGNINCFYTISGNLLNVNYITGNGLGITAIAAANIVGQVPNAIVAGTVYTAAQPNITSVGQLTNLTVGNTINAGNINVGNTLTAYYVDGTITRPSQPNITTIGTLINLTVTGNITTQGNIAASNALYSNLGNSIRGNFFIGAGNNLSNIQGANITGQVSNALISGTVYTAAQPNITSIGTLSSLTVAGTTIIQQAKEKATLASTPNTGTFTYNTASQAIILKTANSTGSFIINFTNISMDISQSMTFTYINKNSTTGYYCTEVQLDGTTVFPNWTGGAPPSAGTINGYDIYNFNIIKTGTTTYVVFATVGSY